MSNKEIRHSTSNKRLILALLLAAISGVAIIVASGCGPHDQIVANAFLGDQACAPCHGAEFQSHEHSNHKITMREVTPASLGNLMPKAGDISNGLALKQ